MHDFGSILWQRLTLFLVMCCDHLKDTLQFGERFFPSVHQGVATWDGWNFCDPAVGLVAIEHHFVVIQSHAASILLKHRKHLLPRNRWIERKKLVESFPTVKEVDQTLNRHPSTSEARSPAHALWANPHRLVEPGFLIGSHSLRISGVPFHHPPTTSRNACAAWLNTRRAG